MIVNSTEVCSQPNYIQIQPFDSFENRTINRNIECIGNMLIVIKTVTSLRKIVNEVTSKLFSVLIKNEH